MSLSWVPSHYDITDNENAGELAWLGSALDISECVRGIRPPLGYFFVKIHRLQSHMGNMARPGWYKSDIISWKKDV